MSDDMLPAWMRETEAHPPPVARAGRARKGFAGRTVGAIVGFFEAALTSEGYARRPGLLQGLDPRFKLIAALALVVATTMVSDLPLLVGLYVLLLLLAYASRVGLGHYTRVVWAFVPWFSGVIVLPLLFNVFMAGDPLLTLVSSGGFTLYVTRQGLALAASFVLRVTTCAAVVVLLGLTTPQALLFRSFRSLGVPKIYVLTLDMAYRYIFLFVDLARDMATAKRSRTIRGGGMLSEQRWLAGRVGYMLLRTLDMSDRVHKAMISRGFTGEVRTLDRFHARPRDYAALAGALGFSAALALYAQGIVRV